MLIAQPTDRQLIRIKSVDGDSQRAKITFDWPDDPFVDYIAIAKSKEYKALSLEEAREGNCIDSLYRTKEDWQNNDGSFFVDYGCTYTLFPYMSRSQTIFAQTWNNKTGIVASITAKIQRQEQKRRFLGFGTKQSDETVRVILENTEGLPDDLGGSCWYKVNTVDYKYPVSITQFQNGRLSVPFNCEITFFSACQNGNFINVVQRGK